MGTMKNLWKWRRPAWNLQHTPQSVHFIKKKSTVDIIIYPIHLQQLHNRVSPKALQCPVRGITHHPVSNPGGRGFVAVNELRSEDPKIPLKICFLILSQQSGWIFLFSRILPMHSVTAKWFYNHVLGSGWRGKPVGIILYHQHGFISLTLLSTTNTLRSWYSTEFILQS